MKKSQMYKTKEINAVINAYFAEHKDVNQILAKDLMPKFIEAEIFLKDTTSKGSPIREVLVKLESENRLHQIPSVFQYKRKKNTYWYFRRIE